MAPWTGCPRRCFYFAFRGDRMKIYSTLADTRLTVFLSGELDHHAAKGTMEKIDRLLDDYLPRDCVLNLAGLTFMDSSGIALILRIFKRQKETGGRAYVENPSRQAQRVIDASGIYRLVSIMTTSAKEV